MHAIRVLAAAAALAASLAATAPALAQSGSVVVIDVQRVIATSQAGKDMSQKLQAIANQMQQELSPEGQAVQTEERSLQQATQNQTADQIRRNTQITQRIEALGRRRQALAQKAAGLERDLAYTRSQALNQFNGHARTALQQVLQQRRAAVAVDASVVHGTNGNVDATNDLISRLDGAVRTINVTRQSAPQQQQR